MPRTRSSDGTTLHYEVRGSGAVDLFLLHEMGSSDTWRPLLGCLDCDKVRAVTCDLRGHGRSQGGAQRFTYPQLNADLRAIADATGMDSCVLVGFSGGCVRVIAARRDLMYNPEFQRQTTLTALPHAMMDVLDRAHFIPCEEPALLARLIEDFCQALRPA